MQHYTHCQERWSHLLHVDLNVLLQVIAVEVENEVVDKVEAIADNDQRELICQFGLLQPRATELARGRMRLLRKLTLRKFLTLSGS